MEPLPLTGDIFSGWNSFLNFIDKFFNSALIQKTRGLIDQDIPNTIAVVVLQFQDLIGYFVLIGTTTGIIREHFRRSDPEDVTDVPEGVIAPFKDLGIALIKI